MPNNKSPISNLQSPITTKVFISGIWSLRFGHRKLKKGFTLIEIMLSIFIIVTLAAILLTASGSLLQTHSSNLQGLATKIATKEVETLRNTAFDSLPSSGSFTDSDLTKLPSGAGTIALSNYQSSTDVKQVTVTVTWQQNSNQKKIDLATLIYRNGI